MKLGIGSFSYRYAIGNKGFTPDIPMDIAEFANRAKALNYQVIQICENLNYAEKPWKVLRRAAEYISQLKLSVELGMNGINTDSLKRHLDLCHEFQSSLLRGVIGNHGLPQEELYKMSVKTIAGIMPRLEQEKIILGIENHFDLTTDNIIRLIREFDSPYLKTIYDTTNSIGFLETPMETLDKLLPYCISAHIKDYEMEKVEAGYRMSGRILGTGQLNMPEVISKIRKCTNVRSLILETTICRRNGAAVKEVLREEEEQVKKSTYYFFSAFGADERLEKENVY